MTSHAEIVCTDEKGVHCGRVEVDHCPDGAVLLEVFDASHFDGKTVTSAVTYMQAEQVESLIQALRS